MYETIEAIYENGKIYPIHDKIDIRKAKVLLTILEQDKEKKITAGDVAQFVGSLSRDEDPVSFQQRIRDEWE